MKGTEDGGTKCFRLKERKETGQLNTDLILSWTADWEKEMPSRVFLGQSATSEYKLYIR